MAAPGASVTVTGVSSSVYTFEITGQSWITIKNLTFTHNSGPSQSAVEVTAAKNGQPASNIDIVDNQVVADGITVEASSQVVAVIGNRAPWIEIAGTSLDVEDNTVGGAYIGGSNAGASGRFVGNALHHLDMPGADHLTVAGNVVKHRRARRLAARG
jgi:hypothetical protein